MNELFKALSDENRRRILDLLKHGDLTAGEIAQHFEMSKAGVSQHLSVLKNAELVYSVKRGQYVYYSLNSTVFQEVLKWIVQFQTNTKGND
ncbi:MULTISPECIES: autorepressor SdpR family transcription factor [Bacillaceae]|uniref:autorepressor SdpR family transcription factor n=1 Tax=Bacillaceae TaxID=186817 RepID=UPI001FB2767D|nr:MULTISPECIES: autorepressor SdpR family transcription factor [Bacillaceae]MDF2036941.1 autorepressor SdpR family transcription factor [Cytobacillus oceanisediminis]UOE57724.1 winged helix-turn-helix transcriptional regulator [Cytobacillus oceanisediminis]USK52421.1 autorepressor SdpR family transcription factor [Bacillus sp. CMF12]